jgi:magnesium chelatase family protein
VAVARPAVDELFGGEPGESTASVLPRIVTARRLALERSGMLNAALDESGLNEFAPLSKQAGSMLHRELEKGRLTARGLHRVWRVARTLADLDEQAGEIDESYVITALGMRARVGLSAVGQAA